MSVVRLTADHVAFRAGCGTFRLMATSASTAALEGEADMAGNGPKTTFMTHSGRRRAFQFALQQTLGRAHPITSSSMASISGTMRPNVLAVDRAWL